MALTHTEGKNWEVRDIKRAAPELYDLLLFRAWRADPDTSPDEESALCHPCPALPSRVWPPGLFRIAARAGGKLQSKTTFPQVEWKSGHGCLGMGSVRAEGCAHWVTFCAASGEQEGPRTHADLRPSATRGRAGSQSEQSWPAACGRGHGWVSAQRRVRRGPRKGERACVPKSQPRIRGLGFAMV